MTKQKNSYNGEEHMSPEELPKEAGKQYEVKSETASPESPLSIKESLRLKEIRELSPNFSFKLIMGGIFLLFTIYFLYLLIRILTR